MIVFLLWAIILILFWPLALIIAAGALVYGLVIAGFWLIAFSIKVVAIAVVVGQMALTAWSNRRSRVSV